MDFLNNALLAPVYYAGLFDGEGSVGLYIMGSKEKRNGYPTLCAKVTNTYREPLDWLFEQRGGNIQSNKAASKHSLWLDAYTWKVYSDNAIDFLTWIEPYTIIKKEQITVAKNFWTYYEPFRKNKYDRPNDEIVQGYIDKLKQLKRLT